MYHANNEDFFRLQVPSMNKIATDNIIKFYFKKSHYIIYEKHKGSFTPSEKLLNTDGVLGGDHICSEKLTLVGYPHST